MGGGSGKGNKPFDDGALKDLPNDRKALSENMMERGRPSFNFDKMGLAAPLAGQISQPAYSTPPPQFNKEFWMNWEKGMNVDGSNYKAAVSPEKAQTIRSSPKKSSVKSSGNNVDVTWNQYEK